MSKPIEIPKSHKPVVKQTTKQSRSWEDKLSRVPMQSGQNNQNNKDLAHKLIQRRNFPKKNQNSFNNFNDIHLPTNPAVNNYFYPEKNFQTETRNDLLSFILQGKEASIITEEEPVSATEDLTIELKKSGSNLSITTLTPLTPIGSSKHSTPKSGSRKTSNSDRRYSGSKSKNESIYQEIKDEESEIPPGFEHKILPYGFSIEPSQEVTLGDHSSAFKPYKKRYDPVANAVSSGVIPYCIHDKEVYLLLQNRTYPSIKKDLGWNDFGGKREFNETTAETSAREFNEEINCLFYLKEKMIENPRYEKIYHELKGIDKTYSPERAEMIQNLLPEARNYYSEIINKYHLNTYVSCKEKYISYLVRVEYIPEFDLPLSEDMHIEYEDRYFRDCRWFKMKELSNLKEDDFHKRLQITKAKPRIEEMYYNGLLGDREELERRFLSKVKN